MPLSNPALWSRISAFHPDKPGATLPFSKRLARENGWKLRFAPRVIEEYKRFAYLACATGQAMSPSEMVDQAWHLHMIYTRNYWDDFCGQTLRQALHHQPTEGGAAEARRFARQYSETLLAYAREFDAEPPQDIWPLPEKRSAPARWRWVDLSKYWVLKRWL